MADGRGGSFTKVVQKHAGRAKERILQNLGRADKTKDEVLEVYIYNFSRQQNAAAKLQKEFKNYMMCIKSMQLASKSLMDTLSEIYEQEWVGHEQIPVKSQTLELLWEDYFRKMNDQVNVPLNTYITQFNDVRGRISKRGRKLVDYDKCRHNIESLRSSAKKRDDYKLAKAREELEQAKQLYEVINSELHDELPSLYESRIPFLVSNLQTLFAAESVFHSENSKVYSVLNDVMSKLASDTQKTSGYIVRKTGSPISYPTPNIQVSAPTPPYRESFSHYNVPNRAQEAKYLPSGAGISSGLPTRQPESGSLSRDKPVSSHVPTAESASSRLPVGSYSEKKETSEKPATNESYMNNISERERKSRSLERGAAPPGIEKPKVDANQNYTPLNKEISQAPVNQSLQSNYLSRYSEQQLAGSSYTRNQDYRPSTTQQMLSQGRKLSYSSQHLPRYFDDRASGRPLTVQRTPSASQIPSYRSNSRTQLDQYGRNEPLSFHSPLQKAPTNASYNQASIQSGYDKPPGPSPERIIVGQSAEYARIRRYSEQQSEQKCSPRPPSSAYGHSVEHIPGQKVMGNFGSSVAQKPTVALPQAAGLPLSRPVELYLVVRPSTELYSQGSNRGNLSPSQRSTPEHIKITSPDSGISVQVTEPGRTSSRMETTFPAGDGQLKDHVSSSLPKEADTRPYEEIEFKKGKADKEKVVSGEVKEKVTEANGDVAPITSSPVPSEARLERESSMLNKPGYRGSYTGEHNGDVPHKKEEKEYEPVDVGAQLNEENHLNDDSQLNSSADQKNVEELYDIPVGATTTDLPPGVLYRVRATYKYAAEDVDELQFESGEIIQVIEYEDPEEQEEGWLMGLKESTGEKGLFPANFTRPI